jgi:hypothetical protein
MAEATAVKTAAELAAENAALVARIAEMEAKSKRRPDEMVADDLTNIGYSLKGKILTLVIDLSQDHGQSGSGKSVIVASTHGNKQIGGCKIGVNVYRSVGK